jgi:hypothetical protein
MLLKAITAREPTKTSGKALSLGCSNLRAWLIGRLYLGTEAVIEGPIFVDGASPYIHVGVYKFERVSEPIDMTAAQPLKGTFGPFAEQDDAGLSIRSASVVERLPNGFGPVLCPLYLDGILRA